MANEELEDFITIQVTGLVTEIRENIQRAKALTDDDRTNCLKILYQVENEHKRLKIEFYNKALFLIEEALQTSDPQKNLGQCKVIAGSLTEMLGVLSQSDERMKAKYACIITGSVASSLLVGITIGLIIVHCHPASFPQLGIQSTLAVSLAPLLGVVFATACFIRKITSANVFTVHRKLFDYGRSALAKCFPNYFENPTHESSGPEIATITRNSIDTFKINEDMWRDHQALATMKDSIRDELARLQKSD
ncbi:unnamed protein product [Adineta ricciae]|uniref:Uncharacterized protein n=1 Tax=Adineta ricciae TaxID=249248 RepID=A0A815HZ43_ADIRI|nr:unnamed protein product [Adineta ricciae]CAF1472071.1 unnamed protein product [Adineta ricciae]